MHLGKRSVILDTSFSYGGRQYHVQRPVSYRRTIGSSAGRYRGVQRLGGVDGLGELEVGTVPHFVYTVTMIATAIFAGTLLIKKVRV